MGQRKRKTEKPGTPIPEPDRLLRTDETVRQLGISDDSVGRLAAAGWLPKVYIGDAVRFRQSDVDRIKAHGAPNPGRPRAGTAKQAEPTEPDRKLTDAERAELAPLAWIAKGYGQDARAARDMLADKLDGRQWQ